MIEELCICGHTQSLHVSNVTPRVGEHFCLGCMPHLINEPTDVGRGEAWHTFKIDNLQFIETLARKKGLL